jgi:hypothetical protein
MKRYNDVVNSNLNPVTKSDKTESLYPSRCLSISLGELEVLEKEEAEILFNDGKDVPLSEATAHLKEHYSKASQDESNSPMTTLKNPRRTLEQMSPREQQAVVLLKSRLQSVPFYARKNLDAEGWLGLAWGMGPRNYGLID